jgi:hypothetical protein
MTNCVRVCVQLEPQDTRAHSLPPDNDEDHLGLDEAVKERKYDTQCVHCVALDLAHYTSRSIITRPSHNAHAHGLR